MPSIASEGEWQQQVVPMVGVTNYSGETCIEFTAGDVIHYRFESEHEVNFDIRYHPQKGMQFKEQKDSVMQIASEFSSDKTQPYCFVWKNKYELGKEWNIILRFLVLPK